MRSPRNPDEPGVPMELPVALVAIARIGMLGAAEMHPRIAEVAVVEITVWRPYNLDSESPLLLAILRRNIETALYCLLTNCTHISQLLVLHVGRLFCPTARQSHYQFPSETAGAGKR